jgi:integrase
MKVRDLLSLKVIDVNGRTHVEKDNKRYPIQKLQSLIEEYILGMQEDDYLFPSRKKDETGKLQPISDTQAYRALRVVAEQMELDYIGTQTMRKTFGYWHYQQYKDVKLLQELLHQQSPSKTLEFIGVTKSAAEDSAEDMDLL